MNKFQNEGKLDRTVRIILGFVLLLVSVFVSGVLQIVFYVLGAVVLITGIIGFCGVYKILGINTCAK
ncbi:MAG: DUF2892 domain-containing protein [Candidatus Falkowbacteria bacterium]|nr:DUF2892 domain-containing protein [Candidatus Falkowbacteria bacterium]